MINIKPTNTDRRVNYLVDIGDTILGPYRARDAEHAIEQAAEDADLEGEVTVYESGINCTFVVYGEEEDDGRTH